MKRMSVALASLLVTGGLLQNVSAHHAFDALRGPDGEEVIEVIRGSIRVFRVMNPHGAMIVNVTNETGETEGWLIELSPASQLSREGWSDEMVSPGDEVSVAVIRSRTDNCGRLRAFVIHSDSPDSPDQLLVSYGIRGDTEVMGRLRDRLDTCGTIDQSYRRTECFLIDAEAQRALDAEFADPMGYVLP